MTPEDFESQRTQHASDGETTATASDLAQLGGAHVELDLETIDQMAGGNVVEDFNFTIN